MTDKECNTILREYLQAARNPANIVIINLGDRLSMDQFVDGQQFQIEDFHKDTIPSKYKRVTLKMAVANGAVDNEDFDLRCFVAYKVNAALKKYQSAKEAKSIQVKSWGAVSVTTDNHAAYLEFFLDVKCIYQNDYEREN